jgi:cytosine/adenosine deaminase-related metal-dependent hydrolase
MMTYKNMTAENAEHNEWLKGLDFYRDDLKIHERRLLELAGRSADPEISKGVEHFQNQFLIQRNTMDELRHSIREHAAEFGRNVARGDGHQSVQMSTTHEALRDGYRSFEKVINELRHEFTSFLSHDHF